MPSLAEASEVCKVLIVRGEDLYTIVDLLACRNEVNHDLISLELRFSDAEATFLIIKCAIYSGRSCLDL